MEVRRTLGFLSGPTNDTIASSASRPAGTHPSMRHRITLHLAGGTPHVDRPGDVVGYLAALAAVHLDP